MSFNPVLKRQKDYILLYSLLTGWQCNNLFLSKERLWHDLDVWFVICLGKMWKTIWLPCIEITSLKLYCCRMHTNKILIPCSSLCTFLILNMMALYGKLWAGVLLAEMDVVIYRHYWWIWMLVIFIWFIHIQWICFLNNGHLYSMPECDYASHIQNHECD